MWESAYESGKKSQKYPRGCVIYRPLLVPIGKPRGHFLPRSPVSQARHTGASKAEVSGRRHLGLQTFYRGSMSSNLPSPRVPNVSRSLSTTLSSSSTDENSLPHDLVPTTEPASCAFLSPLSALYSQSLSSGLSSVYGDNIVDTGGANPSGGRKGLADQPGQPHWHHAVIQEGTYPVTESPICLRV